MSSYKSVQEFQLFTDLLNIAVDGLGDSLGTIVNKNNVKSITKAGKDFILTFPVFVSNNLDPKSMMLLSKSLERKYASLLLVLFNSMNDLSDSTVRDYIRKFHINLGNEIGLSDLEKLSEQMTEYIKKTDNTFDLRIKEAKMNLMKDMKNINTVLPYSISESGIDGKVDNIVINESQVVKNASLSSSDVKKANELQPTVINIDYYSSASGSVTRSFMVGVKTVIYPIASETLVSKLAKADRNKGILNLVRATTREISFVKDFIFSIDSLKKDALRAARNKQSMKEWKRLENRAKVVKLNNLTGMNLAQAISTIIITKDEADLLANEGVDIFNPSSMKYIVKKYSLLGLVIMDEEFEIIHMLFDGDEFITQIPKSSLKKEKPVDQLVTLLGKSI